MKRFNLYFVAECAVIFLLLIFIGWLLREEKTMSGDPAAARVTESVEHRAYDKNRVVVASESRQQPSGESMAETEASVLEGKKIVVFGDSIWNAARGEDGVSEQLMELTGSTVYNCAIGGTTAAVVGESTRFGETWTSNSFNGMVHVANDLLPAEQILAETEALEVIKQVDFEEVDYLLVAYGLNDYFSDVSVFPKEYYELTNYVGALRNGILHFRENYPDTKIVLLTPTYTRMLEGETEFEIGAYVEAMRSVSVEMDTGLADMFHIMGSNEEERLSHLEDGVHLSPEGRRAYAEGVAWYLTKIENERLFKS